MAVTETTAGSPNVIHTQTGFEETIATEQILADYSRFVTSVGTRMVDVLLRPYEYSAWRYEGLKRLTGKYELGKSWRRLKKKDRQFLRDKWPDPYPERIVAIAKWPGPREASMDGWTGRIASSWNLSLSDGVLCHEFEKLIQLERRSRECPPPKKKREFAAMWSDATSSPESGGSFIDVGNGWTGWLNGTFNLRTTTSHLKTEFMRKINSERLRLRIKSPGPRSNFGRRLRGLSWSAIENFDVAKHYGGLGDSQRSAVAKAKSKLQSCLSP